MTTREWITENLAKFPDKETLVSECVKAVGVTRDNVLRMIFRIQHGAHQDVQQAVLGGGMTSNGSVGLEGFRRLHDPDVTIPEKIRAVIGGVLKARGWMYEEEFRTETGLAKSDFYKYRNAPEFSDMRIRSKDPITKQEVYVWAHPSIAQEIRKIAVK